MNPACRVLWRSSNEVQLELGDRAVVLSGVNSDFVRAVSRPSPTNRIDPSEAVAPGAVRTLVDAGYLWAMPGDPADLLTPPRPRLATELAALAVTHGARAAELMAARHDRSVLVLGDSMLAPLAATLLAAGGVGRVHHADTSRASLAHLHGSLTDHRCEGQPLEELTHASIERVAPEVSTLPLPVLEQPDLLVLAYDRPTDPAQLEALHVQSQPHLSVGVSESSIVVGPLVIPGLTSCLACIELHRLDRDPAWQALAAQFGVPSTRPAPFAGWALTAAAALACGQVLSYFDGADVAVLDASVELTHGSWHARRRSWPVHPDCACQL